MLVLRSPNAARISNYKRGRNIVHLPQPIKNILTAKHLAAYLPTGPQRISSAGPESSAVCDYFRTDYAEKVATMETDGAGAPEDRGMIVQDIAEPPTQCLTEHELCGPFWIAPSTIWTAATSRPFPFKLKRTNRHASRPKHENGFPRGNTAQAVSSSCARL